MLSNADKTMQSVKDNQVFLKAAATVHTKQGKALVSAATKSQLDSICEVLLNIVHRVIRLPDETIEKASRYKRVIRQIVKKVFSNRTRKELIIKYFHIVKRLLAAALPVIGVVITGLQFVESLTN